MVILILIHIIITLVVVAQLHRSDKGIFKKRLPVDSPIVTTLPELLLRKKVDSPYSMRRNVTGSDYGYSNTVAVNVTNTKNEESNHGPKLIDVKEDINTSDKTKSIPIKLNKKVPLILGTLAITSSLLIYLFKRRL